MRKILIITNKRNGMSVISHLICEEFYNSGHTIVTLNDNIEELGKLWEVKK